MADKEKDAIDRNTEHSETEGGGVAITPPNEPAIRDLIYTVRGTQVIAGQRPGEALRR